MGGWLREYDGSIWVVGPGTLVASYGWLVEGILW